MKNKKRSPIVTLITTFSLVLSLCSGILIMDKAHAASDQGSSHGNESEGNARHNKISPALHKEESNKDDSLIKVILQIDGKMSGRLNGFLNSNGVHIRKSFANFNSYLVELPASAIEELASFDEVSYVSPDAEVKTLGHLTTTTGADAVRQQTKPGLLGSTTSYTLDGTGVGIAILDS